MQELINQLVEKAGISADQATKAIHAVKDYVKEKFPMMSGAVDNLFKDEAGLAHKAEDAIDSIKDKLGSMFGGK